MRCTKIENLTGEVVSVRESGSVGCFITMPPGGVLQNVDVANVGELRKQGVRVVEDLSEIGDSGGKTYLKS